MKRKELTEEYVINWWLEKYHNTNLDQVLKDHPEWDDGENHSRDFYNTYAVTQKQHDEWHKWFIDTVAKTHGTSKKWARKNTCFDYLNVAPSIKDNNQIFKNNRIRLNHAVEKGIPVDVKEANQYPRNTRKTTVRIHLRDLKK